MLTVLGWDHTQWAVVKKAYDKVHPISVPPNLQGLNQLQKWWQALSLLEALKVTDPSLLTVGVSGVGAPEARQWAAKAIANAIAGENPAPDKDPRQLELNFEGE